MAADQQQPENREPASPAEIVRLGAWVAMVAVRSAADALNRRAARGS